MKNKNVRIRIDVVMHVYHVVIDQVGENVWYQVFDHVEQNVGDQTWNEVRNKVFVKIKYCGGCVLSTDGI